MTTGARRTEIVGWHEGELRVRVAARPVEGKVNAELLRLFARSLSVPSRDVSLVRGVSSRHKVVQLHGVSEEEAFSRLSTQSGSPR